MSNKYIKDLTQNIPHEKLNSAYNDLMSSNLNETTDYEEVSMEELNEYIEGLECQAEDLRTQLAKANETISKLESEALPDDYIAVPSEAWHEQCQYEYELAKANERVSKAEKEVGRLQGIFHKWKQEKDNAVWESDVVFKVLLSETQAYLEDEGGLTSKEWFEKHVKYSINKFAIEKKIEALESFANYAKGDDWEDAHLQEAIKIEIEQLRKEQENV